MIDNKLIGKSTPGIYEVMLANVAGIVGVKKSVYDICGDTINIAARMEQNSDSGKITISGNTNELVKTKFEWSVILFMYLSMKNNR